MNYQRTLKFDSYHFICGRTKPKIRGAQLITGHTQNHKNTAHYVCNPKCILYFRTNHAFSCNSKKKKLKIS